MLTGHLQEERFSANDDASGCANVLEIARALKRMIDDGRIAAAGARHPVLVGERDLRPTSSTSPTSRTSARKLLVNINQDMVGAKQSAGSRVQFVTRPPASRASFLGDVVRVDCRVAGAGQHRVSRRRSRRVSRSRPAATRRAAASPPTSSSHSNADPGPAGHARALRRARRPVPQQHRPPGVQHGDRSASRPSRSPTGQTTTSIRPTTTCGRWMPTQLKRNAVAVAASAWVAGHGGQTGRCLRWPARWSGRGLARIGHDTRRAIALARTSPSRGPRAGDHAGRRERRARAARRQVLAAPLARRHVPRVVGACTVADARRRRGAASDRCSRRRPRRRRPPWRRAGRPDSRVPSFVDDVAGLSRQARARCKRPRGPASADGLRSAELRRRRRARGPTSTARLRRRPTRRARGTTASSRWKTSRPTSTRRRTRRLSQWANEGASRGWNEHPPEPNGDIGTVSSMAEGCGSTPSLGRNRAREGHRGHLAQARDGRDARCSRRSI